ncbi:NACHT domain-containing protein [Fusarium circinatum]|uniref:NACHT domain-containing protein n=1 Tax=Fusarium circinatum TaxID=48490 RepID=A0A8H5TGM3_FUSCI|nr:NACHT domain-containing protein [Fusarium circinatum]
MSGLEPLAALGLVCNVLQLVEVGLKTATLCKNAYRTGEPDPELSVHARTLAETASNLTQSLEVSQQPLSHDDSRLLTLAQNCRDAEQEWRKKTPARFLSQQRPRKRARFGAVLQGIVNKPEITRLESQLQKAKESMETDLLVGVFKRLDISKVETDDLQNKLQSLLQATPTSERILHDLIQTQVAIVNAQISYRVDLAGASTETHVTTELASPESRLKSHADQAKDTLLTQAELREDKRRENEAYESLLSSFQYPDMNHRKNEIHRRHKSTFDWIFKGGVLDTTQRVRSDFVRWLKSSEGRYWISGRPGTGKSVLMKFIISDERTIDTLQQWQPQVRILTHFFWKVGSPMQSSFKGFLCSLAYQLFSLDKQHAMECFRQNSDWFRRTGPGDWDSEDLQSLVASYLSLPSRPFCLFVDGIDELLDEDGVGILTAFLDKLQQLSPLLKICMSSRPEQAIRVRLRQGPDLKMQDLTRDDIEQYSRATLEREISVAVSSVNIEGIVRAISLKAEGVFLWAVLVTRSIARGILNGDSQDDIQKRLLKTPKELYDLYLDMWTRLGEDSDLYQSSTALIFKIVLFTWQSHQGPRFNHSLLTSLPVISILELMLASNDDLRSTPVEHFDKLSTADLEQRCNELFTKLPFRTAELLEIGHPYEYRRSPSTSSANELHHPILRYGKLRVEAIHRTVFDFLIEKGERIMKYHKASQEEVFIRIFKACLLRDCLWPEADFYIWSASHLNIKMMTPERDFGRHLAGSRLSAQLHSLLQHVDIMHDSVIIEMLDLVWASFVLISKDAPWHSDLRLNGELPRCKFDYLLRIAPMGFDSYLRDDLIKWNNSRQFDALYQVLTACLDSGRPPCNGFEWAGRQRLIEHILWTISSANSFHISHTSGLHLSKYTLVKASIACVLINAVNNPGYWSSTRKYESHKINDILRMIRGSRHLLCLKDHLLIELYPQSTGLVVAKSIGCRPDDGFEPAIYVEISMSILVQVFLQKLVKYDITLQRHELEETLNLEAFPQTLETVMLGFGGGYFLTPSSTDLPVFQRYCSRELLPEMFGSSNLEDKKWCREKMAEASRDRTKREGHGRTQVKTPSGIEEGIGPKGLNFYPCEACQAKEKI